MTEAIEIPFPGVGLVYDMPAHVYHAIKAVSSTALKTFATSPAHEYLRLTTPFVTSDAMILGTLVHTATLEPAKLADVLIAGPCGAIKKSDGMVCGNPGARVNDEGQWFCGVKGHCPPGAHVPTEPTISENMLLKAKVMAASLKAHGEVKRFLPSLTNPTAKVEVSAFWYETVMIEIDGVAKTIEVPCKARFDLYDPEHMWGPVISDIKTCQMSYLPDFEDDIAERRYDLQGAWYLRGAMKATLGVEHKWFMFFPVQSIAPHLAACFRMKATDLSYADDAIFDQGGLLQTYIYCRETSFWPGYPDHHKILNCGLPQWHHRNEDRERKRDQRSI